MAKSILVSSVESFSGKSTIIVGLGKIFQEMGYEIGYFKPFGVASADRSGEPVDEDGLAVAKNLGIEEFSGVVLDRPYIEFVQYANPDEVRKIVYEKFSEISEGKDFVFVEGATDYKTGRAVGLGDAVISEMLDLKVLMVAKYENDFVLDRLLNSKDVFGDRLGMAIINKLRGYKTSYVQAIATRAVESAGIKVVGVIPRDSVLGGVFVDEIKKAVGGDFLVRPEGEVVIENSIIGAMSPQTAMKYFRETRNAVLITGGDREDLIGSALEIPTIKCIILTGNIEPDRKLLEKAEEKEVPVILVGEDTFTTMRLLEGLFDKARLSGEVKVKRIVEIVKSYIKVEEILKYSGLNYV